MHFQRFSIVRNLGLNILLKDAEAFGPPNQQLSSAGGESDGTHNFASLLLQHKLQITSLRNLAELLFQALMDLQM